MRRVDEGWHHGAHHFARVVGYGVRGEYSGPVNLLVVLGEDAVFRRAAHGTPAAVRAPGSAQKCVRRNGTIFR